MILKNLVLFVVLLIIVAISIAPNAFAHDNVISNKNCSELKIEFIEQQHIASFDSSRNSTIKYHLRKAVLAANFAIQKGCWMNNPAK